MMHLMKSRDPKSATTKCGRTVDYAEACGFQSAVDCPECRRLMNVSLEPPAPMA